MKSVKYQLICQVIVSTLAFSIVVLSKAQATPQVQFQDTASQEVEIAQQRILYVNPQQGADGSNAGTSELAPLRTIAYALQQAQFGTLIQLAPGQYQAGETFPLQLKPGVILRGDEFQQGQGVVINGGGEYVSPTFARQNITLLAAQNTQVIGVTITNPNKRGTGIWVESTNPIISNSTFANSKREGIFVTGSAEPRIENNQFINNDANGISVAGQAKGEIRGNVFQKTGFGLAIGGTSAPLVADNQIHYNRSGVVVTEKARPILQKNAIANNTEYGLVVISQAQPYLSNNDLRCNGLQEQLIAREHQNEVAATPPEVAAIPTQTSVSDPSCNSTLGGSSYNP